ncbi:hypothetical protein [Dongia sp.]|uniref:hypothetical protein n=1 Tax=Dongia sp. TaxID=1977262 RepID=UPI0035AF3A2F
MATIHAALGPLPLRIVEIALTVSLSWYWGNRSWLESQNLTASIFDGFLIFCTVAFGLLTTHLLVYATRIRRSFEPQLQLSLVSNAKEISTLAIFGDKRVDSVVEYVRLRAIGIGSSGEVSSAFLTQIIDPSGKELLSASSLPHPSLRWTATENHFDHIPSKVERHLDVLRKGDKLHIAEDSQPKSQYRSLFNDIGTYRLTIVVVTGVSRSELKIKVNWSGPDKPLTAEEDVS